MDYWRVVVTETPARIIPTDNYRRGLWVINSGNDAIVYIGFDQNVDGYSGFPLKPGEKFKTEGIYCWKGDIYAVTDRGTTSAINYLSWK